jgi:NitT/TauT family transport system substrate-binding protein
MTRHRSLLAALLAVFALAVAACGGGSDDDTTGAAAAEGEDAGVAADEQPTTVRLGYFPNVTHASAIVGVEKGIFEAALGEHKLEVSTFNAGPAAVEAIFSGALDATYIGPNPAINAFAKSNGEAIRIVSGATSGGAFLVVKRGITKAADLKGKKVASPQLGNTQDVALRSWLAAEGLKTNPQGGGDVSVVPQENAQTLETFKTGAIDGAWVPEPWATRLVQEGGGKVLIDEADLWPAGRFVTTHLIVRSEFLEEHPGAVKALVEGQVNANTFIEENPAEAQQLTNEGIEKITGKKIAEPVITEAWKNLAFTNDPIASSLAKGADNAETVGLLEPVDLEGIYDLKILNAILEEHGLEAVKDT